MKKIPYLHKTFSISALLTASLLLSSCGLKQSYVDSIPSSETETAQGTEECVSKEITFEDYITTLFQQEAAENMLNLHYTVKDPSRYGIDSYKATLGNISKEQRKADFEQLKKTKSELQAFNSSSMTYEQQFTYDVLLDFINSQISLNDYKLFEEPLKPSNGLQAQLPILFAEYSFATKKDVEDYLEMISQTDLYYSQIMDFEREKIDAGLFMSDKNCNDVIEECETFLQNPSEHYLLKTFAHRMEQADFLTQEEKDSYIAQNEKIVNEHVLPAYQVLIDGLTECMGKGTNNWGLHYYEKGNDYYEVLVKNATGSSHSVEELYDLIEEQRAKDLQICSDIQNQSPGLFEECLSYQPASLEPKQIMNTLSEELLNDFPKAPDVNYEISYVDPALEDYLAPAFYIISPIDDYENNQIYINNSSNYSGIDLFTTLAHEGYPGHMYQTVMTYTNGMEPIRSLLDYPGFVEGWATYVEMMSYYYAGMSEEGASLLSHNQAASLSLYATSDIGIHYYGWTSQDMYDFWEDYGITNHKSVDKITGLIVSDPGNYLKYYVGYLGFLELKDKMQEKYGTEFTNYKFHDALLKMGPAPFSLLEKYFDSYYSQTSSTTSSQSSKENSGYCCSIRFSFANSSVYSER